ncbi:MAG: folylpolyglutamate synthase/dihydrofolate synthase family protein [Candidatus Omnitrophota bacterium]|jgi:dihydrofolate synthase/folylpolyglutamate synthase
MDYSGAVDYVNSFINFEKIPKYGYASSFKLGRMEAILKELGDPHKDLNIIHVAGSKGKGSTCAVAAYILKKAGYKAGLYTSPHLVEFRERIRILVGRGGADKFEGMISEEGFRSLVEEIKPVAEKFRDHKTLGKVSFFEIVTACAFLHFKKNKVDAAVLETGLGGRLDATNVVVPLAAGITNISLEHTDKLGSRLEDIAAEKAGIIKRQGKVAAAVQGKAAAGVIRKICAERNAELYEIGKDIKYSIVDSDEKSQVFDLKGPGYYYRNLETRLLGRHQAENASLGIAMLKLLDPARFNIDENAIRKGLKSVTWPGRLQIARKAPYIVLDGAHNPASALALAGSIKKTFDYGKLICVFGMSSDKDIKGTSAVLEKISDIMILTKAKDNLRAAGSAKLRRNFKKPGLGIEEAKDVDEAMRKALKFADKKDLILVTGSLFIVGDAIRYLKR